MRNCVYIQTVFSLELVHAVYLCRELYGGWMELLPQIALPCACFLFIIEPILCSDMLLEIYILFVTRYLMYWIGIFSD